MSDPLDLLRRVMADLKTIPPVIAEIQTGGGAGSRIMDFYARAGMWNFGWDQSPQPAFRFIPPRLDIDVFLPTDMIIAIYHDGRRIRCQLTSADLAALEPSIAR